MTFDVVTAGAVCVTAGLEHGAAAVVVTDAAGPRTKVLRLRAHHDQLGVLGILQALLAATAHRRDRPAQVRVVAPGHLVDAVHAHLADGTHRLPEALHQMVAIAKVYRGCVAAGFDVTFAAGQVTLTDEVRTELDTVAADVARSLTAKQTAGWTLPAADAVWVAEHDATVVYTDGSHLAGHGFGSWAWWVDETTHASGTVPLSTSTHVEQRAALEALRVHRGPVLVVTDTRDLAGTRCILSRTHARVLRQLRRELERPNVRVLPVLGHDTCPGNLAVDRLAGATLAHGWAKVCTRPGLAEKLTTLALAQTARLQQRRSSAGEAWWRTHGTRPGTVDG